MEAVTGVPLNFASMTAADLVKAELDLASKAPRRPSSVVDVEAAFSASIAEFCSVGDRVIFTKLEISESWTVDGLGSVISVTPIGDRWGVLLDGPPKKAVLAPPACFSVLGKDSKLINKFNELGRGGTEKVDIATSPTRLYVATKEQLLSTPLKQIPVRSYEAIEGALDKGSMLVSTSMDDKLYVEGISPMSEVRRRR